MRCLRLSDVIALKRSILSQHTDLNMKKFKSLLLPAIGVSIAFCLTACLHNYENNERASIGERATLSTADSSEFEELRSLNWQQVFFDSGTDNWRENWIKDGLMGTVENSPEGMHVKAGPEADNHAHHMVLWTKRSFEGDVKVSFEYTRTDSAELYVTILYLLASGEGTPEFPIDIMEWAEYRNEPYMRHYFDNMDTYHISYAAFGLGEEDAPDDYIRARRYLPLANNRLMGTALEGDYTNTGFFKTGVPHQITVIKYDDTLWMKVSNEEQTQLYKWSTASHPNINKGRIGLRHMFTRSALYKNVQVSALSS